MKGQRAHPGAEAIAACMGGVRTWRARRVSAHIAVCPSCSALGRQFEQVSTVLAAIPPAPLPGEVALRLEAALAAEVAARAASGPALAGAGVPVPSGHASVPSAQIPAGPVELDGQPRRRPRNQPRAWRVLRPAPVMAALALCLVLGGGGYLISQSGRTSPSSASASAGRAAVSNPRFRSASPAVGRPAIVVGPTGNGSAAGYTVRFTNTNYFPSTLRAQAQSDLSSPGPSPATRASGALQACVMIVTGNAKQAFVDLARYQGRPATVIVTQDHAWVTIRGCNGTQHPVLDSVTLSGG